MKYWTLKLFGIYPGSLDRKLGVFKITYRNIRIRIFICCRWFYRGEKQANKQTKKPKITHGQNTTFLMIRKQLLSVNLVEQSDKKDRKEGGKEGRRKGRKEEKNSSLRTQVINKLKPIKVK